MLPPPESPADPRLHEMLLSEHPRPRPLGSGHVPDSPASCELSEGMDDE